jgi:hypothetical protein
MKQPVTWLKTLDTGVLSSGLQGLVPRWNKCFKCLWWPSKCGVYHLLPMFHIYVRVNVDFSASECLPYFLKLLHVYCSWLLYKAWWYDDTVGSLQLPTFNYDGSWYVKSQSKISSVISLQHANEAGIYGTRVPRMELNTRHLIPWNWSLNIL